MHFISYNNSPTDAAEIKGLIKFHAPKCGLIIAGPGGDLFSVVLRGMGAGDQVRSVRFADHFSKGRAMKQKVQSRVQLLLFPKSRTGEGSKRLYRGMAC